VCVERGLYLVREGERRVAVLVHSRND
jgi:hypothetical protein